MRGTRWMFVAAALVTGTAFAQQQQQQGQQQQPAAQAPQFDEGRWTAELMLANRWSADMSKIAADRAATPSVRKFAQQAVQTHQGFEQQLQQLAQREGIDVTQALQQAEQGMKTDFMHAAIVTSLAGLPMLSGVNLDRAYLSSVVLSHDLAIDKIQWAAKQVKNPRLTQAIQDELNTLVKHRQQAYGLLGQLAPKPQRGQARGAPPISR
ncbi:DUF4142 domain-containing protein [Archangium violaceum]|uniref:DUF4142 domain-containing protein n=1 Tax=Archangium violaceum TaxID=83451 RepID=UPI00193AFBCC|nr:DUF4142 domain-containing protein [Archangium violaceum]QRK05903.1 DUF4142 domain-containing protein [Archangium violaceum]